MAWWIYLILLLGILSKATTSFTITTNYLNKNNNNNKRRIRDLSTTTSIQKSRRRQSFGIPLFQQQQQQQQKQPSNNHYHSYEPAANGKAEVAKTTPSTTILPLESSSNNTNNTNNYNIPRHVAIVMDGNSRWAKARNLPTVAGHAQGADRLIHHVLASFQKNYPSVEYCTVYGFSTENWKRSTQDIHELMNVMEQTARKFYQSTLEQGNLRIRLLGDMDDTRIPDGLRSILLQLQHDTHEQTKDNTNEVLTLCLAINYGGRQDIVRATRTIANMVANGTIQPDQVNETLIESCLSTAGIPDPDLIIRSSGEHRLSNFLLWNTAYAELYFTDTLWPDFDETTLQQAMQWYSQRKRRFGGQP